MRAALIRHDALADCPELQHAIELLKGHCELEVCTAGPGESITELADAARARGARLLIAAGGDGTVSAVAASAIGRDDITLGILPRGTSNSIAAHLGITGDVAAACEVITGGCVRSIDTATCNGRPFVLMATIGLHAEAITEVDPDLKRRYGGLAYAVAEVERMLDDSRFEVCVRVGDEELHTATSALTVANLARRAALLAHGAGEPIEDDGLLDVTLISIDGAREAVATSFHLLTSVLTGEPASRPNVVSFRGNHITVTTREPRRVMVDGERFGDTPMVIHAVPRSLRVCVPGSGAK